MGLMGLDVLPHGQEGDGRGHAVVVAVGGGGSCDRCRSELHGETHRGSDSSTRPSSSDESQRSRGTRGLNWQ
jgi:hypothetical protein